MITRRPHAICQMASRKKRSPKSGTQFLFVHHDSTNLDSRVDAEKVNAHVQVLYRRRKRGINDRWEPNLKAKSRQLKLKMRDGEFVVHGTKAQRKKTKKHELDAGAQHNASADGLNMAMFSIQKGNSDPFSAMPIAVGPLINMILFWHRTQGIPALHPVETAVLASPTPSERRTWSHTVSSVQNAVLVYSYLASVCALMARRTEHQHLRNVTLQLKDRAYTEMRKTLYVPNIMANFTTRAMILNMFWTELATSEPVAASTHLRMLEWTVRTASPSIELPGECKLKFLAANTNLAVSEMKLPVADARDYSVETHFQVWRTPLSWQMREYVDLKALGLHTSIESGELRTIFMKLRELVAVSELVAQGKIKDHSVFQWMDARLLSCELHLLAICVERRTMDDSDEPSSTTGQEWNHYCISLAALTWISSTWASSNRGTGPSMIERLENALREGSRCGFGASVPESLTLWMLYAGAALESRGSTSQPFGTWFSSHLRSRVEKMGLASATDALKRFLYSEGVCPLNLWQEGRDSS